MATLNVSVPDIGDHDAVTVIDVLVKPGDIVNKDDGLVTLESEKAAMDIPAPEAGSVQEIRIKVGDKVAKGSLILIMQSATNGKGSANDMPHVTRTQDIPVASKPAPEPPAPIQPLRQPNPIGENLLGREDSPSHASPSVRRVARELGVELSRVPATGPKNRILVTDIHAHVKMALQSAKSEVRISNPALPVIDFSEFGPIEKRELPRIRKISGAALHRNWTTIPHVTQFDEADITDLEDFRKSMLKDAEKRSVKLTLLAFLIKASVNALKAYPQFNASLSADGNEMTLKQYFHVGFACDTPDGLVVPVVRDVQRKDVLEIAQDLGELSAKARERKLKTHNLQGGSFTISSLGGIGGTAFTPIINWPEVAILGVSRTVIKPVYDEATKIFEPRLILPLSLSYDHRVVDGADGARFTSHLRMVLSDVRRLLL